MDEPRRDAPLADPGRPGAIPNDMPVEGVESGPAEPGVAGTAPGAEQGEERQDDG